MPVSEATYERVALEDPEGKWELVCGRLRSKPGMTTAHNRAEEALARRLMAQLDEAEYSVRIENGRLRISATTFYIPDLCVIPRALEDPKLDDSSLEIYAEPVPLVVEVWSPSTGNYDVGTKLLEYQQRGDLEIWRIHPIERTLIAWRRLPDGSYAETLHNAGSVRPLALPQVSIELESLFPRRAQSRGG